MRPPEKAVTERARRAFEGWYENLRAQRDGFPARGTIGAALVVLERLKEHFDPRLQAHRATTGQSQIQGVSGVAVSRILEEFGETRPFLREGGRTNRGAPGDIDRMLRALRRARLYKLNVVKRRALLSELQGFLVERVRDFHGRQRLKLVYDGSKTTHQNIEDLLIVARESGKAGAVAQHLVGAKLELRYPELSVENRPFSAADEQRGRPGDYVVGSTAFHVTVAPTPAVYERCRRNLERGLRVYLLVRATQVAGARENAEVTAPHRISVNSIESFVSQNIDELSEFSHEKVTAELRKLLETYNRRVDRVEADKSLMIEIPPNLTPREPGKSS